MPSARVFMRPREPISSIRAVVTSSTREIVDVVGKVRDQVERRHVGPVDVLKHQQHGTGLRVVAEQRSHGLEDSQL